MLSIVLIVVAIIIGLVLLLGVIMKKKFSISSSIIIDRSQHDVFEYIRHIKNQKHYSKWVMADPNVKVTYTGTDGTVGFTSSWISEVKNVGEGAQEIIRIDEGKGYEVEIRFEKPFKGTSYAETTTKSISDSQTRLTTTFKTSMPFPMNIMAPFMVKMLQKDMDETSMNLKKALNG
jgi:putative component of toxin-antitoxin plasmid stabilization module